MIDQDLINGGCAHALTNRAFRAWLEDQVRSEVLPIDTKQPPEMVVYRGFHTEGRRALATEIMRRAARHEGKG